jgi:plastocyanin
MPAPDRTQRPEVSTMRRALIFVLTLASAMAFAACGASGSGSGGSTPPEASAPPASDGGSTAACEVASGTGDVAGTIAGNAFDPAEVSATVGQVVGFTNEDAVPHSFTLDDGSCDTGTFETGASGAIRFDAAGSYPFHCTVHPTMTGTVTVS